MSSIHRSVRWRITITAAVIAAAVLAVAAVVVVAAVQRAVQQNLDQTLEQRADQIEAGVLVDPTAALANSNREDRFAQVLDRDGRVLLASENVVGAPALADPPTDRQAASTRDDLPIEDDRFRVLVRRFDLGDGSTQFVVVGENIDDITESWRALVATLAIVFPAAVLVLAGAVWWLVGRTLKPVEQIRSEVESIGLSELDRRVPSPGTGDEIDRLAGTMNEMLARLQSSAEAQRRFVADVSHELRTPLTRLRTALEVDLADPGSDFEASCRAALDDAVDMQDLVDDLLFLARRDAGHGIARREVVDLDEIVGDEVRRAREESGAVAIDMRSVSAAAVVGDGSQLARLVRNLLSNAVRAARSEVVVELREADGGVVLRVDDNGPGIPVDDRERVFERFVRLDPARSAAAGGTGLGLAIVRDIVAAHRGTVHVGSSASGGASFVVQFPLAESPGMSPRA